MNQEQTKKQNNRMSDVENMVGGATSSGLPAKRRGSGGGVPLKKQPRPQLKGEVIINSCAKTHFYFRF